jgi:hypothetical protein
MTTYQIILFTHTIKLSNFEMIVWSILFVFLLIIIFHEGLFFISDKIINSDEQERALLAIIKLFIFLSFIVNFIYRVW